MSEIVVFSDPYAWTFWIQLAIVFAAIFFSNILRNCIPFLRKLYIPSAIIGGVLVLALKQIPAVGRIIDSSTMQVLTYHCLGIGFAAMALKTVKSERKVPSYKIVESGAIMASSYLLQAIVGLAVSIPGYYLFHTFYAAGLILPMGFGQSTGSALSWGSTYETNYGFTGGASYGLAIASVGFVVGSVLGIIYLNYVCHKGRVRPRTPSASVTERSIYIAPNEIPNNESIDKMTLQVCLVVAAYTLAYFFMRGLSLVPVKAIGDLAWGLNFLWALLFAFLIKSVMHGLHKVKAVSREYVNDHLMDRISGLMFDMMIAAGIIAIDIDRLTENIGLFLITCVAGTVATFLYVRKVTYDTYRNYEVESFLTNFGTVTGTVSTGMILLREIDPDYVTPAASNIVLQNFPSMLLLAPLLLTMGFAGSSVQNTIIMFAVYLILFAGYNLYLYRRKIFKKRFADRPEQVWKE